MAGTEQKLQVKICASLFVVGRKTNAMAIDVIFLLQTLINGLTQSHVIIVLVAFVYPLRCNNHLVDRVRKVLIVALPLNCMSL